MSNQTFMFNGMKKDKSNVVEILRLIDEKSQVTDIDRFGSVANALFLRAMDMASAAKSQGAHELAQMINSKLGIA